MKKTRGRRKAKGEGWPRRNPRRPASSSNDYPEPEWHAEGQARGEDPEAKDLAPWEPVGTPQG